ncbi:DUF6059 family protein [Peterkaempfera griseoplana]|uniref:DUF6059 family protein n=1 Tax=Peterkaempfera griseoplana TaxID=66896 RepID=UPI0006E1984C|nr:DUF6059 family protein [Peterkaempfera griseoplana]
MTLRRLLRRLGEGVIAAGCLWVYVPPVEDEWQPAGPPPRHPERLRPDLPLSEIELLLERSLTAPGRRS